MVVSQKHIAVIDPHRKCIKPKSETSPAGTKKKLSTFFRYSGHVSTFESVFNLNTRLKKYAGTIFRFPLRRSDSESDISTKVYTPQKIKEKLFESLKEESPYILLFLRSVKSISLMEWTKGSSQPHETFKVAADNQAVVDQGEPAVAKCEAFARQCSQNSDTDNSEIYVELKSNTVTVTNYSDISSPESLSDIQHNWLVLKVVGTNDSELAKLGEELSILPWVGLATRLPCQVSLCSCETTTTKPFDESSTIEKIHKELHTSLEYSQLSLKWSEESVGSQTGHAYCFLPLPESTAMPVHVHGYFAVTDNRRSIKWPAHDEKGEEAQWNKKLLQKMVAPAYALLLAGRSCLIHYEDTPLPISKNENMTDPYSTWPLYQEVKNVPIWNELLSPTLSVSLPLPLLWTPACGGKWIKFSEAYFLPESNSTKCNSVVIRLLIKLGVSVVSLPWRICETMKQNECMLNLLSQKEISPQFVRDTIKSNSNICSSLSKEEVYSILDFILLDINGANSVALDGIPLLPLKGSENVTVFQKFTGADSKYIFPSDSKHLIEIVPGTDNLIVDPEMPHTISEKLCSIVDARSLQLEKVDIEVMCKKLLPTSVRSWCTKEAGGGMLWLSGQIPMPPESWINALWNWIAEAKVKLLMLEGLKIIPQLADDIIHPQQGVRLIKVNKAVRMCRISTLFTTRQRNVVMRVMKKMEVLIIDDENMNNCHGMTNHPDFEDYIPEISPHSDMILKFLSKLDKGSRLDVIQKLESTEKDLLRQLFSNLSEQLVKSYQKILCSIPVYHAACSNENSPCFIPLGDRGSSDEAFLPPDSMSPLPCYPGNMLSSAISPEDRLLLTALAVKRPTLADICITHLLPLALSHTEHSPRAWTVGDDLVLWILKQNYDLPNDVFVSIARHNIILTSNLTRKNPQEVYDSQDQTLGLLFNVDTDKDYFPSTDYFQDAQCRLALLKMGLKTWKDLENDHSRMYDLLYDRINSVHSLNPSTQLIRGQLIMQTLAEPKNSQLYQNDSLSKLKFLKAESCPSSYPSCLKMKWYGRPDTLYSISELCLPDDCVPNLIGTVSPVLSQNYCHGVHAVPMNTFIKLNFRKVADLESDVLNHLKGITSVAVGCEDTASVDQIVMSVYGYLIDHTSGKNQSQIWWRDTSEFIPAEKFILDLPDGFQFNMEPFYYQLKIPLRRYVQLFQLHSPLTFSDVAQIVQTIHSKQGKEKLTDQQIALCIAIFNWLYEKEYTESGVLMLTKECTLVSPHECVFDDREWMKQSQNRDHIMGKDLTFVHDQTPQKVAKHFNVVPLSSKLVLSEKLKIEYTREGQHEDITQRIRHIVQDYETDIDIFKELIQNADDAKATEVKFLIDWRHHPNKSLLTEELSVWQGPALIAYNNAMFSDEDFKSICSVARETKRNDPLKTGRFGVGFCATYHLSDVPSFISRRIFFMFDPHTSYLGERVSKQHPGMKVDLVHNRADLKFYHDQFKPYDAVFDCNVFELNGDGYQGTLFRFPFRCQDTSNTSKICPTIYNKSLVSKLVQALKEQSNELLLFLKHVTKVSVYELDEGCDPSYAKKIFSVQRIGSTAERIQLMKSAGSETKTCSTKFTVSVQESEKSQSKTWLVSSAIEPLSSDICNQSEAEGLLNLAEVAVQIEPSKDILKIVANSDSNPSKVFCFLPLPIKCKLPFHVNGFFSVGKDRRNVSATDDSTFGSLWNKSLAEGVLISAFIHLLECLCKEYESLPAPTPELKSKFLRKYYSLWKLDGASGLIDTTFETVFKKCAPTLKCSIMWSEINRGCWLPPVNICVFKDSRLKLKESGKDIQEVIEKDAISTLLTNGYAIVDIPRYVYEVLKKSLASSKREFDFMRVCQEFYFPNVKSMDPKVRDRNIKFLVECFGAYSGKDHWYKWAETFLKLSPCISCQDTDTLRSACEMIDPTNDNFCILFKVSEGRFPSKELQESSSAMRGLKCLGMSSSRLSVADLKERALSVDLLEHDEALQRSVGLCEYIESAYHYRRSDSVGRAHFTTESEKQLKELETLSDIPFLPVKQKPKDVDIPWKGKANSFDSPTKLFSSEKEHLVFTQHSVVEESIVSSNSKSMKLLGIASRQPNIDVVIANLKCIIQHIKKQPNDATIKFLDDCVREIYSHLNDNLKSPLIVTKLRELDKFIWQNGCFLGPNQVLHFWNHSCVPYLCELSTSNKRFKELMNKVGVKNEVTVEMLGEVLQEITSDHDTCSPISDDVLNFVVYTASKLAEKLKLVNESPSFEIYLPDENKIMRNTSDLADNINPEWIKTLTAYQEFVNSGNNFYVHKSIPQECAEKLGVRPLLEAVLKEIEDDDFLSGTDFGQHEELCDRLNGILKKYPADISIFKEFIQNADDAQATEIIFVLDRRTDFPENSLLCSGSKWKSLQRTPALCIYNNRKFTDKDIEGITKLGRGGKRESVELIGKFGIGFNIAYHVTDCPSFVSYSGKGSPEYLCVFDPTKSFVPSHSRKCSPGRKWNFKDNDHYSGLPDQFRPYLAEDLPNLAKLAPILINDSSASGHVVFRLPLTRMQKSYTTLSTVNTKPAKPTLDEGQIFYPCHINYLLNDLSSLSKDVLLFLNHLRSISAFEIETGGTVTHYFTTTAVTPSPYMDNCEFFSQKLKQFSQTSQTMQHVSIQHKMQVTHVQPDSEPQEAEWLIQRVISGREIPNELIQAGLSQGLRPIAGVAARLKPATTSYNFLLFCFLPLPIKSNLPVHINGHFLLDDSRKHLEAIDHAGLKNWNKVLVQKVIVPAYVDLLYNVKNLINVGNPSEVKFYYSLFPKEVNSMVSTVDSEVSEQKEKGGELSDLNVVVTFYTELLQQNQPVVLREMPDDASTTPSWMKIKSAFFCVCLCSKSKKFLIISEEFHKALVSLGLPITSAPNHIYHACVKADYTFSDIAAVKPIKIIEHLQRLTCTSQQEEVIKKNIREMLEYCITDYDCKNIPYLFSNALYLLAKDGSLQRYYLFRSYFSTLLPQCSHKFVDESLEKSDIGEQLVKCAVIRALSIKFVSENIRLSKTQRKSSKSGCGADIKLLWKYFIHCSKNLPSYYHQSVSISSQLSEYFSSKTIIPANDGYLYPVCLSKTLVRDCCKCDNCCVMKKLGYPTIDFDDLKPQLSQNQIQLLYGIIDGICNCFKNGEDIVKCFELQPPKTENVDLTEDEALSFIASLGKDPMCSLEQVSQYLQNLPLFLIIDGKRISLLGVHKVFILPSTELPLDGIPPSHNGQVILKRATSDSMNKFYDRVIPQHLLASVNPEKFYLQVILPILPKLQEESIKTHVDYIYLKRDKMIAAFERLKDIAFISRNGKYYRARELCDPAVEFFTNFKPDCILPDTWQTKVELLKNLDLQSKVSQIEWLQYARKFSHEYKSFDAESKSSVLLKALKNILQEQSYTRDFLCQVADVEFLYSPQKWELSWILSTLFPRGRGKKPFPHYMVKFQGSVSFHEANLACLCKPILPENCQNLIPIFKKAQLFELPASPETVAKNLIYLCDRINVTCTRSDSQRSNSPNIDKLIQIFDAHYAYLSKRRPSNTKLHQLKDMMCILPSKNQLLQLVKPSQLVMQLPSDCFFEPYCFKVENWLQKHVEFLTAVGVKQELKAQDYVNILLNIKEEVKHENTTHDKDGRVIKSAYRELVCRLRQGDTIMHSGDIFLPDENLKLTIVTELCLDDAPWYRSRLSPDCGFRMILPPPADDNGHRTIPGSLKVKPLSDIVTEVLQEACKSSDFACTDEELFKTGKRQESGRCVFVKNIIDSLKSDELRHGLCRMYFTEHKCPPSKSFKISIQKVKQIDVHCLIGELKTVLSINNKIVAGTEINTKLCHLCCNNNIYTLYIAPHKRIIEESDLGQFFKELAVCIGKLIDDEIKNMSALAAVFGCSPNEIPQTLTREQIHEYSEDDYKVTKGIKIGSLEAWSTFPTQESLIVVNFDCEDTVRYIGGNGKLINAEVVKSCQCPLFERKLVIRVKEKENGDDLQNLTEDEVKTVSPLQVFKVLTASQKKSIWSRTASPYASPVVLASLFSEDSEDKITQFLSKLRDFQSSHSELEQCIHMLHLICHMHYQLVIQKGNQELFNKLVAEMPSEFLQTNKPTSTSQQTKMVLNVVKSTIKQLQQRGVSEATFPSKDLAHIIDNGVACKQGTLESVPPASVNVGSATFPGISCQPQSTPSAANRYPTSRLAKPRRGYQYPRYAAAMQGSQQAQAQPVQPNTCERSAKAWLEQAKADFNAAKTLLGYLTLPESDTVLNTEENQCKFPALVCFLCHDTVEKCIKGVYYIFCGLRHDLVNCSNLTLLHDGLERLPQHLVHLRGAIKECVMTVNRHESASRFPNTQYPLCAPATVYCIDDAQEAFQATLTLLRQLQSEKELADILQDLGELPVRRFVSVLQSEHDNQGI